MSDAKITVHERQVNSQIIVWTTLIGGFISSLVKWGSEVNMPPRVPGEISPPGANIDAWLGWLGFNSHSLDYVYQGATVPGAVTLYHWCQRRLKTDPGCRSKTDPPGHTIEWVTSPQSGGLSLLAGHLSGTHLVA